MIIIQDTTRININQVCNCKLRHPPTDYSEDKSQPLASNILWESSHNRFSHIKKRLIGNNFCCKEELSSIYRVDKICPKLEVFEVTPKLSPETIPLDPTSNQEEKQVHIENNLIHVPKGHMLLK